jgi:hypothetical protein
MFVMEESYVLSEVRAEFLNFIYMCFGFKGLNAPSKISISIACNSEEG